APALGVDINGPQPGSLLERTFVRLGPPVAVAPDLTIDWDVWPITEARIVFDPIRSPMFEYDLSGTDISASFSGSALVFTGVDTVANYQQVLRSLKVSYPQGLPGFTTPLTITFSSSTAASMPVSSVPVNSLVTVLDPRWPIVDLNGDEPGIQDTVNLLGG